MYNNKALESNVFNDWLSCTIPISHIDSHNLMSVIDKNGEVKVVNHDENSVVMKILSLFLPDYEHSKGMWYYMPFGSKAGYSSGVCVLESIHIYFEGSPSTHRKDGSSTIFLELNGSGCRDFETISKIDMFDLLYYLIVDYGAIFTRFDNDIDIFHDKYFTIPILVDKCSKGEYVCASDYFDYRRRNFSCDYDVIGESLYIGSEASDRYLLIYDKKLERISNGQQCELWVNVWIRFEMRFKHEWAQRVALAIIGCRFQNGHDGELSTIEERNAAYARLTRGLLFAFIDFKSASRYSVANPSRDLDTWIPWKKFLCDVDKIKLTRQAQKESTILSLKNWASRSVSRCLSMFLLLDGDDEFSKEMLGYAFSRIDNFSDKDLAQVNSERLRKGLPSFSMDEAIEKFKYIKQKYDVLDAIGE